MTVALHSVLAVLPLRNLNQQVPMYRLFIDVVADMLTYTPHIKMTKCRVSSCACYRAAVTLLRSGYTRNSLIHSSLLMKGKICRHENEAIHHTASSKFSIFIYILSFAQLAVICNVSKPSADDAHGHVDCVRFTMPQCQNLGQSIIQAFKAIACNNGRAEGFLPAQ